MKCQCHEKLCEEKVNQHFEDFIDRLAVLVESVGDNIEEENLSFASFQLGKIHQILCDLKQQDEKDYV